MSMLDADAVDALLMGGTMFVRDTIVKGKPKLKRAAVLAGAQYAYDKTLRAYLQGALQGFTGEAYFANILANAAGVSAIIYAADMIGLVGRDSDPADSSSELAPQVSGSGKSKKVINAIIEGSELVLEQRALVWALNKANVVIPGQAPAPAKTG